MREKPVTRRLKVLRAEKGLNQFAVAARAKVSIAIYVRIEQGYRDASPEEQARIARVFGLTPPDVFPVEAAEVVR